MTFDDIRNTTVSMSPDTDTRTFVSRFAQALRRKGYLWDVLANAAPGTHRQIIRNLEENHMVEREEKTLLDHTEAVRP